MKNKLTFFMEFSSFTFALILSNSDNPICCEPSKTKLACHLPISNKNVAFKYDKMAKNDIQWPI